MVEKYGRFPHRNEIHSRDTTPEEVDFLKNPAFRFDLPLKYGDDGSCKFVKTDSFDKRQQMKEEAIDNEEE